ncbi:MAG: hypothetical protein KQH63_14740 [Desulfobulbaceae bacterium]|nr:hypothetical protein [Desulfobulbaceae bacterium]
MKIGSKKKLYLFFLLLFTISGIIVSYALLATNQFSRDIKKVSRQIFPESKIALEMKGLVSIVIEKFNVSRAAGTEAELENIDKLNKQILSLFKKLQDLSKDEPPAAKEVALIHKTFESSYQAGLKMISASVNQEYEDEAIWTGTFDSQNKKLFQSLNKIVANNSASHTEAMTHVLDVSRRLNTILLFSIVLLAAVGAMTFYLIMLMSRQLDKMSVESTLATNGLLDAIANINSMSVQLANETSSSSSSLDEIVSTMDSMSEQTKESLEAARTADKTANDLHETATRSNKSIADVDESMTAMVEADREISSLVKDIEDIAFQTNLLALNAAVEAARAGEAGAGFAVVADEVRNLAIRTADTSSQVATIIQRLDEKVTQGVEVVENLKKIFSEVTSASDFVVEQMSKIKETGNRQADTEEQIRTSVTSIDDMVQSQAAMSEEASATVQDVQDQVEKLHRMQEELMLFWEGSVAEKLQAKEN